MQAVNRRVKLPPRYSLEWAGEYESQKRSEARLLLIVPLTVFLIFLIIYGAFGSAKWACLHLVNVAVARVGGLLALYITGTHFSVSSGVGFLALFGASVQTGVIMVEYINQLRARGLPTEEAAIEGAVRQAPAHHDDHVGGHARSAAGRALPCHRLGFPTSVRHRNCWRIDRGSDYEHFPAAHLLRLVGEAYRSPACRKRRVTHCSDPHSTVPPSRIVKADPLVGGLMSLKQRALAEFIGTFWLVFGGCGSAVLAAAFPNLGIGFLGVWLVFGLTLLTMAYAIGHISGCHINPAVSIGLAIGRRFPARELPAYIGAQVVGGIFAAVILYLIASGRPEFDLTGGFASNGFGAHSPGLYNLGACALAEVVLTFMFLMVILGATDERAPKGFAPIAIGFAFAARQFGRHSSDQYVGQSCPKHRSCRDRRRMGHRTVVAILAGAHRRRRARGPGLSRNVKKRSRRSVPVDSQNRGLIRSELGQALSPANQFFEAAYLCRGGACFSLPRPLAGAPIRAATAHATICGINSP